MSPGRTLLWFKLARFRLQRGEFYRDVAEMYRRGESVLAFLEGELGNAILTGQGSRARALRIILSRYTSGLGGGRFGYILRGVMPASDAMMIEGAERAPDKAAAFLAISRAVDQQVRMLVLVGQYSMLPAVIAVLCIVMIAIVSGVLQDVDESTPDFMRPELWSGFNGVAKIISDCAASFGGPLLVGLVASVLVILWSLPWWTGSARLRADRLPVYSLYRDFQAGMLFSSLAMLLQSGGTLRGSIEDLAQRASPVMRWHLRRVLRSLDEAPNLTIQAFSRGVLSRPLLARAATLARKATSFADVLIELGTTDGERVLQQVKVAAWLVSLMVTVGLGTLAVVLGFASFTAPTAAAELMEPTRMMAVKKAYDRDQRLKALAKPAVE